MRHFWKRTIAAFMMTAMLLTPAAHALTPQQLLDLLDQFYINEVPEEAYQAETIDEILGILNDPYTVYMDKDAYSEFWSSMQDTSVVGIGISATSVEEGLMIVDVYEGGPAAGLGVEPGDIITSVSGISAAGQTAEEITARLKGEEGTKVSFELLKQDGTRKTLTAVRAKVVIPATTANMMENGTTGYINCTTFGQETTEHFKNGIKKCPDANLWVVDLRTNGGGDVRAVAQSLGCFLGKGTMFYLRDGSDAYYRYVSEESEDTIYPAIVLTSGRTASAAEIFSLGMKSYGGGIIIGSNTFGKGVAQIILNKDQMPEEFSEDDAMKITAYEYYSPDGVTAQTIGVIPDLLVDTNDADEIAMLLTSREPEGGIDGWLQLKMGSWRWYINLNEKQENPQYLEELLEAIPPSCSVQLGEDGEWKSVSTAEAADFAGLEKFSSRMFTDVAGDACENAANTLGVYQMVRGYGDGTFRPNGLLTRAELSALLVQGLNLKIPKTGATYTDVSDSSWYAPYVRAVTEAGFMEGNGDGTFSPRDPVTHEQLMAVMGRIARDVNMYFYNAWSRCPADTGISDTYSDWAKPWVWLLERSQKNILGQSLSMLYAASEDIEPQASATRGETVQMLYTILFASSVINY